MPAPYSIADNYTDVASLALGLHQHRLELANTDTITSQLSPMLVASLLSSNNVDTMEQLIAVATSPQRVDLRKAILAFVYSKDSLRWVLKNSDAAPPSSPIGQARQRTAPAPDDFYTYFEDAETFNTAMSMHMNELVMSRPVSMLLAPGQRVDFMNNTVQTSTAFTRFMFSQASPDLYKAVSNWIRGRPALHQILKQR